MNKHIAYFDLSSGSEQQLNLASYCFQQRTHVNRIDRNFLDNTTLLQLSSGRYHTLPTHCHPCNVSQYHWAGKRKFGELSPIGDIDVQIEFSHQYLQNRQNSTRQNPTLGWKITTRPEWVGNFLHARGFECGTRALHYYH